MLSASFYCIEASQIASFTKSTAGGRLPSSTTRGAFLKVQVKRPIKLGVNVVSKSERSATPAPTLPSAAECRSQELPDLVTTYFMQLMAQEDLLCIHASSQPLQSLPHTAADLMIDCSPQESIGNRNPSWKKHLGSDSTQQMVLRSLLTSSGLLVVGLSIATLSK